MDDHFKPWPELAAKIDALAIGWDAYGRMVDAALDGDDDAYARARAELLAVIPSTPTPSVLEDTGRTEG